MISKREQVLARLDQRNKEREADVEIQKTKKDWSKSQNVQNFESQFDAMRRKIGDLLRECEQSASYALHAEEINTLIQSLQKLTAESALTLSSYELRKGQKTLQELCNEIVKIENSLQPKKQFSFSTRKKEGAPTPATENGKNFVVDRYVKVADDVVDGPDKSKHSNVAQLKIFEYKSIKDKDFTIGAECSGSDVALSDIFKCSIKIVGTPSTLYLNKMDECSIISLPVSTSIFVSNCQNVTFVLACQQLRVHSSAKCQFYLHVTSKAIIEDCRELSFAPYGVDSTTVNIKETFADVGLDLNRNSWDDVEDFNWPVSHTHSPNWKTIDEKDRKYFTI